MSSVIASGNNISSNAYELPGIFAESTNGQIRGNIISGHTNGIHLGNSSPDIGGNIVTDCKYHGIYIGIGSYPNMRARLVYNPLNHLWYEISGYNQFYENGGYEEPGGPSDNDGSEIYFNNSNAIMNRQGCNQIYDDRPESPPLVNTLLLMSGECINPPIVIDAQENYWGETEISNERFGNLLSVNYTPYLTEPCPLPDKGEGEMLVTRTSTGEPIDTLYPAGEVTEDLSEVEMLYSEADKLFITGEIAAAENYYDQIINIDTTLAVKKEAYSRKYEIGKVLNRDTEYFEGLESIFSALSESTPDSLLKKIFNQLSSLTLVAKTEYIPAIGEFDGIVQQNPNTEEAVYAEIDALTTALLVEGNDSTMQKGSLGKYLIKTSGDYNKMVGEILRKHFGSSEKEDEEVELPTEYTLYQNYPNPFNPATTIKYDLPNASNVSIIIYDILGRKVKELVHTKQQAGRYEIQFNASNLASGVYIYQLVTDNPSTSSGQGYISAKKMILLK